MMKFKAFSCFEVCMAFLKLINDFIVQFNFSTLVDLSFMLCGHSMTMVVPNIGAQCERLETKFQPPRGYLARRIQKFQLFLRLTHRLASFDANFASQQDCFDLSA